MIKVLINCLSFRIFLSSLFVNLFILIVFVHADRSTPKGTVIEVIKSLKQENSYKAVLDYIHWPSAFNDLRDEEKKNFEISSPNDLRKYLTKAVSNPEQLIRKRFELMLVGKSEEERQKFNKILDKQIKQIRIRQKELRKKIEESTFSIVGIEQNENTAQVNLKARFKNTSETKPLNLIKINEKWYLTAASING